jgi:hypothetical protein
MGGSKRKTKGKRINRTKRTKRKTRKTRKINMYC